MSELKQIEEAMMNMSQVEKEEMSDALISLQLCNYNNPTNNVAIKNCAASIRGRALTLPVRDLMHLVQMSPQPLRSVINALQKYRPTDLKEGTLSIHR
ncbi:hypothetical protein 2050HW_00253 [Serratia phage vB_SmaM_ 2050HW]|uniref:DUF7740 domain-containing protein n=1 Tax=Serratia phage vB_SmaM_ 2050HW TaxID=2024252 RepID=A0A289ZU45_9CAUD|nr:hypothetical protein HWB23_gp253 [Serratia phage vB_SmaM_ 2050HW]ATA65588.1 hypothetical protein 2050HW_00253 [Serratia phage vB_SmaM_ 2050HW]UCR74844.1 hypothetical protein [Serratia phage BUCT660]